MESSAYELLALAARYVFAGLMVLIVLRAWRITVVDSRRAAKLRRLSPETGLSGELVVLEGGERAKKGMRYPVIREGMIGTSRRADIRIRNSTVRRRHAYFVLTERGLFLRGHASARLRDESGRPVRELTLGDGGHVGIGRVHLLLVLTEATAEQEVRIISRRAQDDLFDLPSDPFETNPLAAARKVISANYDGAEDYDAEDLNCDGAEDYRADDSDCDSADDYRADDSNYNRADGPDFAADAAYRRPAAGYSAEELMRAELKRHQAAARRREIPEKKRNASEIFDVVDEEGRWFDA